MILKTFGMREKMQIKSRFYKTPIHNNIDIELRGKLCQKTENEQSI